ncbi:DUF5672 family protein [Dyadobacter arcticus]|uniref:DUF5672 domain-containing protein n=1 Tax=Dyadobacter arcticus TaxID=1078754 RepID=A0ABX0UWR7_9BACT|nr:DUF5672 family protein [Dyadobacter arcticus]NIJ56050.1 hypothetical protein [Dyadobacter arcticus]
MKDIGGNSSVAVVIPIYQSHLTKNEEISLRQCMRVLGAYPVIVVKPKSLKLDFITGKYPSIALLSMDDAHFKSIDTYNKLLISIDFYRTFSTYQYILLYQLDAYVFRDELLHWCQKGYDYVGAPSFHQTAFDALPAESKEVFANALSNRRYVLNGGLSLRNVPAFIRYLKIFNAFYPAWKGNEDMLFSQEATRLIPMKMFLKLPGWQEALQFSFEKSPAAIYELTNHQLPFACHAWERYDPGFWSEFISVNQ